MSDPSQLPSRDVTERLSDGVALYALFVLAIACPLVVCAIPRPLAPVELPSLQLSASETEAVINADATAARNAPRSPLALELERLFLEHGEAETRGAEATEERTRRLHALHATYLQLIAAEGGEPAALSLRAQAVNKLEAALNLQLPDEQLRGVMGAFANGLAAYHATANGEELAPHFVIRTLYKARWNMAMGLALDYAFAKVEQRAYHGFLALHADNLGEHTRLDELTHYAAAGGSDFAEARGVLSFRERDRSAAVDSLTRAYAATPSLRLRNYLLGARIAAGLEPHD